MPLLSPFPAVVVIVAALIAAATDIWKFKVYNALTLPLLLGGLIYHAATAGWAGLANSALGLLFGFAILLLFYAMGGMGAGDVKLMAAIGAWLGMPMTFYVFIASGLAGGVYAVALLVCAAACRRRHPHAYPLAPHDGLQSAPGARRPDRVRGEARRPSPAASSPSRRWWPWGSSPPSSGSISARRAEASRSNPIPNRARLVGRMLPAFANFHP